MIKTKLFLLCQNHLDACCVKGYFLEKYSRLAELRQMHIEVESRLSCSLLVELEIRGKLDLESTVFDYVVIIEAEDEFDRKSDFTQSAEYLSKYSKCLDKYFMNPFTVEKVGS